MNQLVLPLAVEIKLNASNAYIKAGDIFCFSLHLFAKNKIVDTTKYHWSGYDYLIQPIFSQGDTVYIPDGFLKAYEYGMPFMEFRGFGNCFSLIEITLMSPEEIENSLNEVEQYGYSSILTDIYGLSKEKYLNKLHSAMNANWITDKNLVRIRDTWESKDIKLYEIYLSAKSK